MVVQVKKDELDEIGFENDIDPEIYPSVEVQQEEKVEVSYIKSNVAEQIVNNNVIVEKEDEILLVDDTDEPEEQKVIVSKPGINSKSLMIDLQDDWQPSSSSDVISVNTSIPNDGRAYYCLIQLIHHSNPTIAFKNRNRQVTEVIMNDKFDVTKKVIDPRVFEFIRICQATDFK